LKCATCGVEVDLPFRCNYCEHYYCPAHRLPENHDCSETWRVKAVRSARANAPPFQLSAEARSMLIQPQRRAVKFSKTETRHLILGTALVSAAGISFFIGSPLQSGLLGLGVAAVLFAMGFILHELAHKYVAQGYGLWAEFRLNMTGLLLTALSIVSPIKFIAPGAVVISGLADKDKIGRTAFAGPLVNIIITASLLIILPIPIGGGLIHAALLYGAAINAFLALFNLIPFSVFDGKKVFAWNRRYWAILIATSTALTAYTYLLLQAVF
jgi:Zn-dependent protease